jgi:hypothetical protein
VPQTVPADLAILRSYMRSPYRSVKHSSYFQVYEDLLSPFRGRPITFVEVGVLNGGSLFMWRDYFGPQARIIGVEFNPLAERWRQEGFEIFIGDQSSPEFWRSLFDNVGDVDIVLDDGGHTNKQQIVTATECIPHVRDGGMHVAEDTHTSYFRDFGNPSKYSFIEWCKIIADSINSRCPGVDPRSRAFSDSVYSLQFFESIVAFRIDRRRCIRPEFTVNDGVALGAVDYLHKGSASEVAAQVSDALMNRLSMGGGSSLLAPLIGYCRSQALNQISRLENRKLKRYFR